MTSYTVQFELPVNNPEKNVSIKRSKKGITFYVPINHPDITNFTYSDLVAASELSGLLKISTPLNSNNLIDRTTHIKDSKQRERPKAT